MWANILFVILLQLMQASAFNINQDTFHEQLVTYLRPYEPYIQDGQMLLQMLYTQNMIHVFCKQATRPTWLNVFQTSRLRLKIAAGGDYKQYKAETMKEVYQAHRQLTQDFEGKSLGLGTSEHQIISLSAYTDACYGIYTDRPFSLTLEVSSCDLERVAQFTFGLVLWASCPILVDSLLWVYCTTAALGAFLPAVIMVFGALLVSGKELSLGRLCMLQANFKQAYEERAGLMTMMLLGGAWISQAAFEKIRNLWRYRIIRTLHYRLVRCVAYCLIITASERRVFGFTCLFVLFPFPEVWHLIQFLWTEYDQRSNQGGDEALSQEPSEMKGVLKSMRERMEPPTMQQISNLLDPNPSGRLPSEINILGASKSFEVNESSSFNNLHMRRRQEERDRQGYKDETPSVISSTWKTVPRRIGEGRFIPYPETTLSPIQRNPKPRSFHINDIDNYTNSI